jgi:hypothetical protein
MTLIGILFDTVIFIVLGCVYYLFLAKRFDNFFFKLVIGSGIANKHPANHLFALVNIAVAGFFQSLIFAGMLFLFQIPWKNILIDHFKPIHLIYGLFLGFGDFVVCNMAGSLLMRTLKAFGSKKLKDEIGRMSNQGVSGWVNFFKLAFENFSFAIAFPVAFFYICFEELIFRGTILFTFFQIPGIPFWLAILVPALLFTLAQRPGIPSTLNAVYPMCSAFTIGMIHNWLLLKVYSIIPLIIAHMVFLLIATIPAKSKTNRSPSKDSFLRL